MKPELIQNNLSKIALIIVGLLMSIAIYAGERTQIKVLVTDEKNQPLTEVMASIRSIKSTKVIKSEQCNTNGNLTIENIKKGKYMILINKVDFSSCLVATFEITEVKNQPVEITVIFHSTKIENSNLSMLGAIKINTQIEPIL
ncbi:MAG: hypothetical protein PHV20_06915 [Bacteroidales bacterium]|nr:hypothetical protein [Bacteroidales bacterium]